ncbi:MAG: hypothetical protein HYR84_00055, partial [Planctomycetes bacterium]|nr:hypothetical protein [Planctomycetota bacterium]
DNGDQCPDGGGPPGPSGPPKGINKPTNPANDVGDPGGKSEGTLKQEQFKKLVADWGRLPPREQQRALVELTAGMSPRHAEAIRNYFRNLNLNGTK